MARVFYGPIEGDDWRDLFNDLVEQSYEYSDWTKTDRVQYATEFWDAFYNGGPGAYSVQRQLIEELGIDPDDFDWELWKSLYEEI